MTITVAKRRWLLSVVLVATLAASVWTHWRQSREETIEPAALATGPTNSRTPLSPPTSNPNGVAELRELSRADVGGEPAKRDPFAVKSWQPAPPLPDPTPPPPPPPPMEPTAPALPFKYVGRQEEVGHPQSTVFYFSIGEETFIARRGEKLANDYQFDGLENVTLLFTYLPLSVKQTLPIGDAP